MFAFLQNKQPIYQNYGVVLPMLAFWMATDSYDIVLTNREYSPEHQAERKEITAKNPLIAKLWRRYLQSAMTLGVIGHVYDLLVFLGHGEEPYWPAYLIERLIFKLPVIIKLAHLGYRMCWSDEAKQSKRFTFAQRCLIQAWLLIIAPFGHMNEVLERKSKLSWYWDYIHTFLHLNVHLSVPWFYDKFYYGTINKLD
ncbi:hypothetical protein RFI_23855 [Reticulomyxa filosa]|uniref:Uncharacterized protein n=1 Tax=Reticulomyxa filosa TaxID=46433 RepID=X6MHM4_RETFI|nr:hypothetical protein RFI_23855 [Reticulomyxa filosa]|eukprot:ETO13513.1 hypothetical protein RFI_23855 [Reticulomyxa filosa]